MFVLHNTQNTMNVLEYTMNIQKYGIENFKKEVLATSTEDMLDELEIEFIKKYNTLCPHGYNTSTGGTRGKHCKESCEKMRQSKLGEKNHNFGKPRSDDTKQRIADAKKGEKHHFFGKTLSEQHKAKCAKAHRKSEEERNLPMYLVRVKARPQTPQSEGYAVVNHPHLKNKYFTSKQLSNEEKYQCAYNYLLSYLSMNDVH